MITNTVGRISSTKPKVFHFKVLSLDLYTRRAYKSHNGGCLYQEMRALAARDSRNMYKAQRDCLINTCCNNRMWIRLQELHRYIGFNNVPMFPGLILTFSDGTKTRHALNPQYPSPLVPEHDIITSVTTTSIECGNVLAVCFPLSTANLSLANWVLV